MASAVGNLPRARDGGRELAELETVKAVLGQEFTQKEELALVRENHGAVIRELQRVQKEPGYVSEWVPKTAPAADAAVPDTAVQAQGMRMR